MATGRGDGYVGQGLGVADILAALFAREMTYQPGVADWDGRDRFVLSTGHYAIGLYAALAVAGFFPDEQLDSYGGDGAFLPPSTHHEVPGVESTTGSLGQGLPLAVGMAIAARLRQRSHRVFVLMSDGELQEGSTWEAAMFAAHHQLDGLVTLVDVNRTQADGDLGSVLEVEPVVDKFTAFGWHAVDVDGNDIDAVVDALADTRDRAGAPHAVVCHTKLGSGVPMIERKERAHFVRVAPEEWAQASAQLDERRPT